MSALSGRGIGNYHATTLTLQLAKVSAAPVANCTLRISPATKADVWVKSLQVVPALPIVQVEVVCVVVPFVVLLTVNTPEPAVEPVVPQFTARLRMVPARDMVMPELTVVDVQGELGPLSCMPNVEDEVAVPVQLPVGISHPLMVT